jgi:hypothetical protein
MRPALLIALMGAVACNPASSSPTTGLTGTVVRGPVTPVCRVDIPCDAPFSAGFIVERSGRQVAQFRSDSDGQFTVWLSPGGYRIIPGSDAPLLAPMLQARAVEVGAEGLTSIHLEFDTGIR